MFFRLLIFAFIVMTTSTFAQTPTIDAGVSQTLAKWRAANYSDVRYKLNLTLEKMSPVLKGTIEIRVKLSEPPASAGGLNSTIILDWRKIRGKEDLSAISNVSINGKTVTLMAMPPADAGGSDKSAKFEETNEHLVFRDGVAKGENVIKLDFESPIATSGAAITRYVDKEDGAEYVYSLFVPSDASTAFPVFDQPDLKARFSLTTYVPMKNGGLLWKVVSNSTVESRTVGSRFGLHDDRHDGDVSWVVTKFNETKPISTYVFAFAAGDFAEIDCRGDSCGRPMSEANVRGKNQTPESAAKTSDVRRFGQAQDLPLQNTPDVPMKIYVRKSQAGKFKQHAAEVFRLNREGVKFLESWFDYKFPFPKYDLVLIPEFPFGGMEHAGATFLREDRVIFPTEPTKNDYITRANVIFHEAAHQWFGDTVTMRWFDDLWLKEGFAEFMAYKTLEKVIPEYNAWKIFYERNKEAAYLTDSTRGTTPIYQEIPNLSAAKSAYGNIVYRKAPSFLRQAEFYLGEDKFQTAVRAFLKKHEFANAEWTDLVKEFETASKQDLKDWANVWVTKRGMPKFFLPVNAAPELISQSNIVIFQRNVLQETGNLREIKLWREKTKVLIILNDGSTKVVETNHKDTFFGTTVALNTEYKFVFPNYQDYGYGIFLLDERSRAYVLANVQTEKDDFLRTMMWGALWDSVRETELNPKDYVELVIKNINVETDESTIQTLLGRVSTAMNYYLSDSQSKELAAQLENLLVDKMQNAPTLGQRITFYRAFLSVASTVNAQTVLKNILSGKFSIEGFNCRGDSCGRPMSEANVRGKNQTPESAAKTSDVRRFGQAQDLPLQKTSDNSNDKNATLLKTKDKFDIVAKLLILSDKDAANLLAELEKTETSDEAKRYAYAARAGIATAENKQKFFSDFVGNKEISESYIEAAFVPFNSTKHADLTLPFLENALKELPNLKRNRKIFFVNGWLAAFIGGQKSEQALQIVNKFLTDNPNLDKDLRLKILENSDALERAVKIRAKFAK